MQILIKPSSGKLRYQVFVALIVFLDCRLIHKAPIYVIQLFTIGNRYVRSVSALAIYLLYEMPIAQLQSKHPA